MRSGKPDSHSANSKQLTSRPIGSLETKQLDLAHLSTNVSSSRVSPCKVAWMIIEGLRRGDAVPVSEEGLAESDAKVAGHWRPSVPLWVTDCGATGHPRMKEATWHQKMSTPS